MLILEITDNKYPKKLLNIKKPPPKLYVEGNVKLLSNVNIAIVGARNCSEYGIKYTKKFAKYISKAGVTIISGLANGIDSIAHEVSKIYKGSTIAVLGSGLSNIYPKENENLFKEIIQNGGCVVSEYEPEYEVNAKNFPRRNRIISGLSDGILVIESRFRSGSNITAKYGFEQNKKVFCLPRDIGITLGVGTNNLIKMGAHLITKPSEILEEVIPKKQCLICENNKRKITKIRKVNFSNTKINLNKYVNKNKSNKIKDEYKELYNLISYIPKDIHYFVTKSGLEISQINEKLTMLELEGHIKSLPGNNYVRR